MHILHFSMGGTPVPAIFGGAVQQTIQELSEECVKRGHKVTVIVAVFEKYRKEIENIDKNGVNYKYIYIENESKKSWFKRLKKAMRIVLKNGPYDVVQIHVPHFAFLFKMIRKQIGNPKIIWHVHNRSKASIIAKLSKIHVVGISNSVIEGIGRDINEDLVSIIPNISRKESFPVLSSSQIKQIRLDLNIPENKIVIGFAGRISPEKGLHILLDALKDFTDTEREKISIIIAGSSWFKDAHMSSFEKEIFEKSKVLNVKWLGYVDNWILHKFYNACDIFVVPSIWEEPAGQVVLEAQSCGVKVLASDIGGIPEYLSPFETTFVPSSSTDLAFKLKEIIQHNSFTEKKLERANWVNEKFSIDKIVDSWIKQYYQ